MLCLNAQLDVQYNDTPQNYIKRACEIFRQSATRVLDAVREAGTSNYAADESNRPKCAVEFSVVFHLFTPDTIILLPVAATLSHVMP
jgi:hypothetical protein